MQLISECIQDNIRTLYWVFTIFLFILFTHCFCQSKWNKTVILIWLSCSVVAQSSCEHVVLNEEPFKQEYPALHYIIIIVISDQSILWTCGFESFAAAVYFFIVIFLTIFWFNLKRFSAITSFWVEKNTLYQQAFHWNWRSSQSL